MRTSPFEQIRPCATHGGVPVADGPATLRPLLTAVATTDLDDHGRWTSILDDAAEATTQLAAVGVLPPHLTVARTDAPVLAARLIAAAWRHVTAAPARPHPAGDR
ncbi:MAG: hypothetical protein JJT89_08770 [Nitriliruptoraceae bacterium]|nr:hypothetical protein [Nitriliruptoraceae bacterium]